MALCCHSRGSHRTATSAIAPTNFIKDPWDLKCHKADQNDSVDSQHLCSEERGFKALCSGGISFSNMSAAHGKGGEGQHGDKERNSTDWNLGKVDTQCNYIPFSWDAF